MNTDAVPDWLADPGLTRLWATIGRRLERNGLVATGTVTFSELTREERHAVGGLLGRTLLTDRTSVDLAVLDADLTKRSGVGGLVRVIEALTGDSLASRPAQRSSRATQREAPFEAARDWLRQNPTAGGSWTEPWLAGLRRSGALTGVNDGPRLVCQALAVLSDVTPRRPDTRTRSTLAAALIGDAHALDDGTLLAHLVQRGLAVAAEAPPPRTTRERRDLWEQFAISTDSVSSTCLVLGLRALGAGGPTARLNRAADDGDPQHLTAWDLRRLDSLENRSPVLVCENPAVLEATAERFGGTRPVVCASGQPALVVLDVLHRLAAAGVGLRYHGDFDWPGIAIANRLIGQFSVQPWLMTARDYRAACPDTGLPLTGATVPPSWDRQLGHAMERAGLAVHEEAVLDQVLDSLGTDG
jgi:uncharacterized protein (TIGR02679 family)